MREIQMPVWQFVRLMVKVEETLDSYSDQALQQLYDDWEEFWADLDARLVDIGNRSREEFANMMMDQEVHLHSLTDIQIGLIRRETKTLIKDLRRKASAERDPRDKRNLNYESRELGIFLRNLDE